jgi:DNA-binding beta-propeller fold protein YncE
MFSSVDAIVVDATTVYVADAVCSAVRAYNRSTTEVTTKVGELFTPGSTDSPPLLDQPRALGLGVGFLLIGEYASHVLRRAVLSPLVMTTVAGLRDHHGYEATSTPLLDAHFYAPSALAIRGTKVYVADEANVAIRAVDLEAGHLTVTAMLVEDPSLVLSAIYGVAVADSGRLFGLYNGLQLFELDPVTGWRTGLTPLIPGEPILLAGVGGAGTSRQAVVVGNYLYVADIGTFVVRRVSLDDGTLSVFAGEEGVAGVADGLPGDALFTAPTGLTACGGALYVTESEYANRAHVVRRIELASRMVTTVAGGAGRSGWRDDVGVFARFNNPQGIACDGQSLYVADSRNQVVRQIVIATGAVTTLAGSPGLTAAVDGTAGAARFNYPQGLVYDPASGDLFVTDRDENVVRRIH